MYSNLSVNHCHQPDAYQLPYWNQSYWFYPYVHAANQITVDAEAYYRMKFKLEELERKAAEAAEDLFRRQAQGTPTPFPPPFTITPDEVGHE